ncbi:MAG: histidinol-phosphate transaminase [Rhodospirillaceae bacterium]|jgi:histidinol-phosphate aminotransferase|nr:histidinol-phosphate transaminase [Rhodospirillaceae bacterium]MBT4042621.1 histidinol-phosphate transaminase [Rhodospirillaceae bacterium]MBT4687924.1 histidinol-phosphate transaminase [Rhodospirillaceae bacterium]MBT5083118.1 histidinol-phosphate transaminase [Rhodospirillaceae bacterium]MBT5877503.1 histidinol-phosphate transaminase [Rhodospirillaceae bacterium]
MTTPTPIQGILDITPYVGGDASVEGLARVVKLSSNEGATGASPKAKAAFREVAENLHRYPDGSSADLRAALAEKYGLNINGIICGNGSDEIISHLIHSYAGAGDEVVYPEHGFLMYPLGAMASGATPVKAAEDDFTTSVDAILGVVTDRTKMVFVANPNNPTGTYISNAEMQRLRAGLPDDVMLVIDSAYAEFVSRNDYNAGIEMVEAHDNVVMTRTFSKIYGLGGLRLGWAYCPEEIAMVFHRVRGPFNVNAGALAAGLAALLDVAHTDAARAHNDQWLAWMQDECNRLQLSFIPSVGNFLTIKFDDAGPGSAAAAQEFLSARGILPRGIAAYGLAAYLRFTIGLEDENRLVIAAIEEFLETTDGA